MQRISLERQPNIPLALRVGPTKMRASLVPKAFGKCVEAYFCLAFLFLFQQWKKKEEWKEITYPLANLVATLRIPLERYF
jgi:hypothetical protein